MKQPRKHIPLREKLAAALALALPQELRDLYREKKVDADVVISQFEFDHIALHAFGGSDAWHNLDPMLKPAHRWKSLMDTSRAAKVKRLREKNAAFVRDVLGPVKQKKPASRRWLKRKFT